MDTVSEDVRRKLATVRMPRRISLLDTDGDYYGTPDSYHADGFGHARTADANREALGSDAVGGGKKAYRADLG